MDIPNEVRNIALRQQLRIGRLPQWFRDLQAGTHRGCVPGTLATEERRRIAENERRPSGATAFARPIPETW